MTIHGNEAALLLSAFCCVLFCFVFCMYVMNFFDNDRKPLYMHVGWFNADLILWHKQKKNYKNNFLYIYKKKRKKKNWKFEIKLNIEFGLKRIQVNIIREEYLFNI